MLVLVQWQKSIFPGFEGSSRGGNGPGYALEFTMHFWSSERRSTSPFALLRWRLRTLAPLIVRSPGMRCIIGERTSEGVQRQTGTIKEATPPEATRCRRCSFNAAALPTSLPVPF